MDKTFAACFIKLSMNLIKQQLETFISRLQHLQVLGLFALWSIKMCFMKKMSLKAFRDLRSDIMKSVMCITIKTIKASLQILFFFTAFCLARVLLTELKAGIIFSLWTWKQTCVDITSKQSLQQEQQYVASKLYNNISRKCVIITYFPSFFSNELLTQIR